MPTQLHKSRQQAFENQGGKCFYCSVTMWSSSCDELARSPGARRLRCTAEHLLPRCEGGSDLPENVVAACAHCNHTRHKYKKPPAPDQYRTAVRRRVERGAWHHHWVHENGLIALTSGCSAAW